MKRILLFSLICFIAVLPLTPQDQDRVQVKPRGKTEQIGKATWFTEQNSFGDIVKIAQKENKPIMTVFSATWCGPCKKVKKQVFQTGGFVKVANKAVLLYIEQTDPKARVFIKKNNVKVYPTFKLFSKNGKLLHTGYSGLPERTVDGFSSWIDKALAGKIKPRKKTVKLGAFTWYTEQNSLKDMLKIAQKENKPILVLFSLPGTEQAGKIQKDILSHASFKDIQAKFILLFVNYAASESRVYIGNYGYHGPTSFLVLSKEGELMERWQPRRKNAGDFRTWIKEITAGGGTYDMLRQLKKDKDNIPLILKVTAKKGFDKAEKYIPLLLRAIQLKPDVNTPSTQQAYERLVPLLYRQVRSPLNDPLLKQDYIRAYHDTVMAAYNAYYPDKFQFELKGVGKHRCIIGWLIEAEKYKEAISYYDDFLKWNKRQSLFQASATWITREALPALLHTGRMKEALQWREETKKEFEEKKRRGYSFRSLSTPFVTYYSRVGQFKKAEEYAGPALEDLIRGKSDREKQFYRVRWAMDYGVFADGVMKELDDSCKNAGERATLRLMTDKAKILARIGKKTEAKKLFYHLYETLSPKAGSTSSSLNQVAWAMVEAGIVDQKTLEIAQKAAAESENPAILDTLASVHAALGHYKEAVQIEEKALAKAQAERDQRNALKKINAWKQIAKQ
jgi:thioredoxin-related protein